MTFRLMAALAVAVALAGCHDNNNNDTGGNPPPVSMDYSTFVQALIAHQTCDTGTPADLNAVDFTFDADQDTALPIDVSAITPGCST